MSADAVVGACDDLVLHTEDLVDWKGDAQEGGMRGWIIPMRARRRLLLAHEFCIKWRELDCALSCSMAYEART